MTRRRPVIARALGIAIALAAAPVGAAAAAPATLYGMIGQIIVKPGQRAVLARILLDGTDAMPGCLSYVVAEDPGNPDALWVTEVWTDKASHDASLALPRVQAAVAKGRPLIISFGTSVVTTPLGGTGLGRR